MENLKLLKAGKDYTMLGFNSIGYPHQQHFKFISMTFYKYKGLPSYVLNIKGLDGRKDATRITDDRQFVIWEGYYFVNTEMVVKRGTMEIGNGLTVQEKRYMPFDPRYMMRGIASVTDKPLIKQVKPILGVEKMVHYQCVSELQ